MATRQGQFAQHLEQRGGTFDEEGGERREGGTGGSCFLAKGQSVGEGRQSILIPIIASFSDCNWVDPFSHPAHPCLHPPDDDDGRTFPQQRRKVETREEVETERERERVEIYIFFLLVEHLFEGGRGRRSMIYQRTNDHRLKVICPSDLGHARFLFHFLASFLAKELFRKDICRNLSRED